MGGWYDPERGRRVHSSEVENCHECGRGGVLADTVLFEVEDDLLIVLDAEGESRAVCKECADEYGYTPAS